MSFVLDNSIVLAWCFEDEQTPREMALLDRVVDAGAVAPQLWPIEALNGLLTAERCGRIDRDKRVRLVGLLRELPIRIDEENSGRLWEAVTKLAERYRLTSYDACYLELAIRLGMNLATNDKALIAAASDAGVLLRE